jgi:transforming growth factor-beta-induced protein
MKRLLFLSVLSVMLIIVGCSEESLVNGPEAPEQTNDVTTHEDREYKTDGNSILDIAAGNKDFEILVQAVQFVGLEKALATKELTAFAPTNDAFVDLLNALGLTADELFVESNKRLIKTILLYHLSPGTKYAADVVANDRIKTLAREYAHVRIENGQPQIGNDMYGFADIVAVDIKASNGVIHVLNKVILPKKLDLEIGKPSILEIAKSDERFSILVEAVKFAGFESLLSGKRHWKHRKYYRKHYKELTAFAPTNDAFIDLLKALDLTPEELFQKSNKKLVQTILAYHLVPGSRFAAEVASTNRFKTLAREYAYIRTDKGAQIGNSKYGFANIIITDVEASNGVVHAIDKVIVPKKIPLDADKPSILEIAASDNRFSTLVAVVQFTSLESVLGGKRQITAFAPTNDAFDKLFKALGVTPEQLLVKENIPLLRKILKYHLVKGELWAEDVVSEKRLKTLAWEKAYIRLDGGAQIGNDKYGYATIIITDVDARNGVVHALDTVILPPSLDL